MSAQIIPIYHQGQRVYYVRDECLTNDVAGIRYQQHLNRAINDLIPDIHHVTRHAQRMPPYTADISWLVDYDDHFEPVTSTNIDLLGRVDALFTYLNNLSLDVSVIMPQQVLIHRNLPSLPFSAVPRGPNHILFTHAIRLLAGWTRRPVEVEWPQLHLAKARFRIFLPGQGTRATPLRFVKSFGQADAGFCCQEYVDDLGLICGNRYPSARELCRHLRWEHAVLRTLILNEVVASAADIADESDGEGSSGSTSIDESDES